MNTAKKPQGEIPKRKGVGKSQPSRQPFIFGRKTNGKADSRPGKARSNGHENRSADPVKRDLEPAGSNLKAVSPAPAPNLDEALKGMLQTAREQGELTYDDIN